MTHMSVTDLPLPAETGRSGLSGSMKVGQIAQLVLDDSIAFRVRFEGRPPPQGQLYFRGPVLSSFDGNEWRALRSGFPQTMALPADLQVSGPPVRYDVTMEPNRRPWLFVMESTPQAPEVPDNAVRMSNELQWFTQRPLNTLVRYSAESYPTFRHGPLTQVVGLQDQIELPGGFNSRTLALAHPHADTGARGYSLFMPPAREPDPMVAAFTQWLQAEVAADGGGTTPP